VTEKVEKIEAAGLLKKPVRYVTAGSHYAFLFDKSRCLPLLYRNSEVFQQPHSHLLNHRFLSFFDSFVLPRSANWQRSDPATQQPFKLAHETVTALWSSRSRTCPYWLSHVRFRRSRWNCKLWGGKCQMQINTVAPPSRNYSKNYLNLQREKSLIRFEVHFAKVRLGV